MHSRNVFTVLMICTILYSLPAGVFGSDPSQTKLPQKFTLDSTSANVAGPINGKIVSMNGTPFRATCEVHDNSVVIKLIDAKTNEIISEDIYKLLFQDRIGIASSSNGNVIYLLDFENKTFYHGQANLVIENGCVMTKTSIGSIK